MSSVAHPRHKLRSGARRDFRTPHRAGQCPVPATFPYLGCLAPDGEAAPYNSPTATLQVGLTACQTYTSITVDSTLGQTTVGTAEVLATGGNTTQIVTIAAGSTGTRLNVLPFVANAAEPALTSTISITNSLANESPPKGLLPAGIESPRLFELGKGRRCPASRSRLQEDAPDSGAVVVILLTSYGRVRIRAGVS